MNIDQLHSVNPYKNFTPEPSLIKGWHSEDLVFTDLILEYKPKLIIEVGTWLGASAIHMARICRNLDLDTKIVCVDTWLGAIEFWTDKNDPDRYKQLGLKNGYPSVYYQFLSNVVNEGFADMIIPFPQTSQIAAEWFFINRIKADMVYIDAAHDAVSVRDDALIWKMIVNDTGVLFGDDWETFPSVRKGIADTKLNAVNSGNKWIVR